MRSALGAKPAYYFRHSGSIRRTGAGRHKSKSLKGEIYYWFRFLEID